MCFRADSRTRQKYLRDSGNVVDVDVAQRSNLSVGNQVTDNASVINGRRSGFIKRTLKGIFFVASYGAPRTNVPHSPQN